MDGSLVAGKVMESEDPSFGFNAQTEEYGDLFKFGVIDPTKVARTALLNAASAIGLALTTDVLVTELKETKGELNEPVIELPSERRSGGSRSISTAQ